MELLPDKGSIVQVDPNNKVHGGCLYIVKEIDHERDEILVILLEPEKKGSYSRYFKIPTEDCEVIGMPIWLPDEIDVKKK